MKHLIKSFWGACGAGCRLGWLECNTRLPGFFMLCIEHLVFASLMWVKTRAPEPAAT